MNKKEEQLVDLFDLTVAALTDKIESGEAAPADFANVRNLLRDNNITCDTSLKEHQLSRLATSLPDLPDDDTDTLVKFK